MVGALDMAAHEGVDLGIALNALARLDLPPTPTREGGLRKDLAGEAHTGTHLLHVLRRAEIIEKDARRVARIRRSQAHPTAAVGAHRTDMRLETVLRSAARSIVGHGHGQEVVLEIRVANAGAAADEAAGLEMVGRPESGAREQPPRADPSLGERIHHRVERHRLTARHLEVELEVVVQVLTHPGQRMLYGDAVGLKLRRRTDAREFQELRRVDRPAADDDLTPRVRRVGRTAPRVLHARRPSAFQQDPGGERTAADGEVGPRSRRMQIGDRRTAALPAAHGHVETAEAFLLVTVDVIRERIAGLLAGREPRGMQRVREASIAGL